MAGPRSPASSRNNPRKARQSASSGPIRAGSASRWASSASAGVRAGHHEAPRATWVRVRLAGERAGHPVPSAHRVPVDSHHLLPGSHEQVGAPQRGDQRGQRLVVRVGPRLGQRLGEVPFRLGEMPPAGRHPPQEEATQGEGAAASTACAQSHPPGLLDQHQAQGRSQQPPFPARPVRGDIRSPLQVGGGQRHPAVVRLIGRHALQISGQILIRLLQGGHPMLPGRRLADHQRGAPVQLAAPGRRNADVDGVPDQQVAHRTGQIGSSGDQSTRPAATAASIAALGESTCAACPS